MDSPVCGFLPVLAARSTTSNVPKPVMETLSPSTNVSATILVKAVSDFSASFLEIPAF